MKLIQKLHVASIIRKVANQKGISTNQCRSDMTAVIEAAWATTDPIIKQRQIQLVGEDRVPTLEEFLFLIATNL